MVAISKHWLGFSTTFCNVFSQFLLCQNLKPTPSFIPKLNLQQSKYQRTLAINGFRFENFEKDYWLMKLLFDSVLFGAKLQSLRLCCWLQSNSEVHHPLSRLILFPQHISSFLIISVFFCLFPCRLVWHLHYYSNSFCVALYAYKLFDAC